MSKKAGLMSMLKGINLQEIQQKAQLHDEITVKTLEIVAEIQKKLELLEAFVRDNHTNIISLSDGKYVNNARKKEGY